MNGGRGMRFYDVVECPYCRCELDASEGEFEGEDEIDVECESCGKEFEVIREWEPIYGVRPIEYVNCELCNEELRVGWDDYHLDGKEMCHSCCYKEIVK